MILKCASKQTKSHTGLRENYMEVDFSEVR